jgi:hypothetical protein
MKLILDPKSRLYEGSEISPTIFRLRVVEKKFKRLCFVTLNSYSMIQILFTRFYVVHN